MEIDEVRAIDVWVVYKSRSGRAYEALRGFTGVFRRGDLTVVYGPSGSGKTTLLLVLATLLKPDRGRLLYGDVPVYEVKRDELAVLRRMIGISFQDPIFINALTLRENIEFSLAAAGKNPREHWDRVVGLAEYLGVDGLLDKKPGEVSGGEARRVSIIMALVHDPSIVFLDEPTAYLDRESAERVIDLMRDLRRGRIVVVATHDPAVLEIADKTYQLSYGELVSSKQVE